MIREKIIKETYDIIFKESKISKENAILLGLIEACVALALFTFPSLAAYEKYRSDSMKDKACLEAYEYAQQTRCIISYERNFMKPLFDEEGSVKVFGC